MALGITKQQTKMVAVLLSGALLTVLNLTVLSPALPSIMRDLEVDATTVQWLTSGYGLVEAIVIPLCAWLMGRFRTRQLFIGGELLFAVGCLLAAFAPSFSVLLVGRLMQACATGVVMTMTMTLNVLIFPREKRGTAMGIIGLIIGFAPAIGPSLGGIVADLVGWRSLFILVLILTVLVIAVASRVLTDFKGFERTKFDVPSVLLSSTGLFAFLYGIASLSSADTILIPLAYIAAGLGLVVAFVYRQGKLEVPFLRVDILKTRNYRIAVIGVFVLQGALVGSNVVFPLYIQQVLGQTATVSGLIMLPGALLGAFCGLVAGRLFDRLGIRPLALTGGALVVGAAVLLVLLGIDTSILFVVATTTLFTLGIQSLMTPLNTWGLNSLDNKVLQHANSVTNTMNQVAVSVGTVLIVSLSAVVSITSPSLSGVEQLATGYHYSFMGGATLLILAALIAVFFARNKKGKATASAEKTPSQDRGLVFEVAHIMNAQSASLSSASSVREAIDVFAKANTSGAPIVDESGRVLGFISTGDILKYLGDVESALPNIGSAVTVYHLFDDESFKDRVAGLLELNVMDIATRKVISVSADTTLEKACTILANRKIKKLPVVEGGKLIGVISRKNVVQAIASALD
ncbi:MAG: MDR family MFS transporter [Raoultibacter sp.]